MTPSDEAVTAARQGWNKSHGTRRDSWRATLSAAYAIDGVGAGVRLAMSDEEARQKAADWWSGCHSRAWLTLEYLIEIVRATVPSDAPPQPDPRDAKIADLQQIITNQQKEINRLWRGQQPTTLVMQKDEIDYVLANVPPIMGEQMKSIIQSRMPKEPPPAPDAVRQAAREAAEAANTVAGIAQTVLAVDAWHKIAAAFRAIAGDDK